MNKFFAVLYLSLFCLFLSCKEIPPFISYEIPNITLKDTSYLTSIIPNSEKTKVVIEDLTGVNCSNCPKAADKLKSIRTLYPEDIISIGEYPWSLANLTAPWLGFDTLNTKEADDIFINIFNNPPGIPTGGVNRKLFNGETTLWVSYFNWAGYADIVKSQDSKCVLSSQILNIDTVLRKAKVKIKIIFTQEYEKQLNLSVYLSENKILSKQHMPDGSKKDNYEHNHVLRYSITPYSGSPLKMPISNKYEAGRVFEKEFEINFLNKLKIKNCNLIFIINRFDNESKEIIQANEIKF